MINIPNHIIYTNRASWRSYGDLTLGKVYKVEECNHYSNTFKIKDDIGHVIHVNPAYFNTLEDIRDQKRVLRND